MRRILSGLAAAALALCLVAPLPARAQATNPPANTDIGAVISNALRTAGTVTTSQLDNLNWRGVVCTYAQTVVSGSPSTTFSIQGYDAATNTYNTLATSTTIASAINTPYAVEVAPGVVSADAPASGVSKGLHLPRKWRVSQTVGGSSGPAVTGHIGCVQLN